MALPRLTKIMKGMDTLPVSAMLISNLTNLRYLTGIQASSGLLLVTKKQSVAFLDSRYSEMASKRAERGLIVEDPSELKTYLSRFRSIGYEPNSVTVARLDRWKKQFTNKKFVQVNDLTEGLRRVKDQQEIKIMKDACCITKKALSHVTSLLRYGMTEKQLSLDLYVFCMKHGAEGMAFETIVGFGENTSKPHHRPTDRRLTKGDVIQVDMGAVVQGYCSDYSRVYFTAAPNDKQKKAYAALKEAKKSAEKILKPGVLNTALDQEARRVLKYYGYDSEFSHSLGHGVGMDIHEGTTLSMKAPPVQLKKNEVITIEPGLYFPGKFGMRLEDTRIVGDPTF